jgi:metallo-beta-lactamase class B
MEQAMFVKRFVTSVLAVATVTSCTPPEAAPQANTAAFQPIKQACAGREGWGDPAPPAHVFGNVYMVGTCGIVSLLITTPEGHFLIDGAVAEAAMGIADNIRKLGFDPKDVRYLLATHEHIDHAGGLAGLKRITGAKFVTRAEAKAAMESGVPYPTDPQLGLLPPYEGVKADRIIGDGDTLRIGKQVLTLIATPGHTPGGTSWTWRACEGETCHQIVYADSLNAVSADKYRFTDHPDYVATLRASITRIMGLKKCDILIGPHPAQSSFFERLAGEAPLVDRNGCSTYASNARERLDTRLAKEAGQ